MMGWDGFWIGCGCGVGLVLGSLFIAAALLRGLREIAESIDGTRKGRL